MKIEFTAHEARIIGCLVEKQVTTPEQYPLSLNALTNACNQKSNRDPVLDLAESEVQSALDALARRHLVLERSGFGSRVPKYQQRFCNTEFSVYQFSEQERALVCELLLRGPQTPGELRSRAARMADFTDAAEVEAALEALATREGSPLVVRLAREPGRREARYAHLLGDASSHAPAASPAVAESARADAPETDGAPSLIERLEALEQQVQQLLAEVARLKRDQSPQSAPKEPI